MNSWCKHVQIEKSYVRLNNPILSKLGGGHRVSKIEISDNWDQLTTKPGKRASGVSKYGQAYDYKTEEVIDGKPMLISSGVASYEPIVGAEENPFREMQSYDDNQPLGPTQRSAIELPLGEMLYPSPSVGYSKVTVKSIHNQNVKSATGSVVTEFYTSRDFPVQTDFTNLEPGESHVRFKSNSILTFLKLDVREKVTLSQGFRIQTNDMNGKVKSTTSFAQDGKIVSYTKNNYRIIQQSDHEYKFITRLM